MQHDNAGPPQRRDGPASFSQLDQVIRAEIRNDGLARQLKRIAADPVVRTIVDIGASSGAGSTAAFVAGARLNPAGPPIIHAIEVSRVRFGELVARYRDVPFVRCINESTVSELPTADEVRTFHATRWSRWRRPPLGEVLRWLQQDRDYMAREGIHGTALRAVGVVDAVLIDGSEFTGSRELPLVYGARWIALDDIRTFKNRANYDLLRSDAAYELVTRNWWRRNGYAVFRRRDVGG